MEHPGKGYGMCRCKICNFCAAGQGEMMRHYRKEHPKAKKEKTVEKFLKTRGGKTFKAGLTPRSEEPTTRLSVNKDNDVSHAWDILRARSNDSNLSRAAQKDFDKLEDETADLPEVAKWPTSIRDRVIKLYDTVVNGVTEDK